MVIKNVTLETVCGYKSELPVNSLPEIAFAGKSNVGKSSLINTLMERKSLARTSSQPGKTQTINFYRVNDDLYLTDLPGYGFAKVPEKEKQKWGRMIENYLNGSKQLRAIFLLIDIRHDPSENDRLMYEWIVCQGFNPIIIATKADKIKRSQIGKQIKAIRMGLDVEPGTVIIPFSAVTRQGRDEIRDLMEVIASGEPAVDALHPQEGEKAQAGKAKKETGGRTRAGKDAGPEAGKENGKASGETRTGDKTQPEAVTGGAAKDEADTPDKEADSEK